MYIPVFPRGEEVEDCDSLKETHFEKPFKCIFIFSFFFQWSSAILECKHHRNRQNLELRIWMPFFRSNLQSMYIPNITVAQQARKLAAACKTAQVIPSTSKQLVPELLWRYTKMVCILAHLTSKGQEYCFNGRKPLFHNGTGVLIHTVAEFKVSPAGLELSFS